MTEQQLHPGNPTPRPGQMTAVMRAVVAAGPKVLRIGVVQAGRVVEERVIKHRVDVTVGPSEKSMFVVSARSIPGAFTLFEVVGDEYCLNFTDSMSGRIALPTGISDLAMLKGRAKRRRGDSYQIRLSDDSRGKLVIGDTTFLFQFVVPPPVQPKPQLPVAVMRGGTGIDWPTTVLAAFSFLIHFLLIGALYSDWLDPIVDEERSVAGLVESVKSLPIPPPIEQTERADSKAEETASQPAAKQESRGKAGGAGKSSGAMSTAQAAALSRELDSLELATVGGLVGQGPATAGVLEGSDVATGLLDQAAASAAGVSGEAIGGLRLGSGGGTIRPGEVGGGLANIASTGKGEGTADTAGKQQKVQGPKGTATVGGATVAGGTVSNADRVVAGMRAGFRACFNRELQSNPDAQGRIMLTIKVGPGGEVLSVSASPSGNLGSAVACVKARAAAAQFAPPEGGTSVIQVPVTFVKQ